MLLYLIGKSNGCPIYIDDENRKSTPKRHKWSKDLLLTMDSTKGTDETRFPLTRECIQISNLSSMIEGDIELMIDWISLDMFPMLELHLMDVFNEGSVSAIDHVTKRKLKASTVYTCTSTNVNLDPDSFPGGIDDLFNIMDQIDFKDHFKE